MAFDAAPGCVPVNLFAPSLYSPLVGDFATAAERNYLFDDRDFATEYRQTVVTYYMTGTLFELLRAGVSAGIGAEYREDQITSVPDHVARDGTVLGILRGRWGDGQKYIQEVFWEVELPILAGQIAASELTMNLSHAVDQGPVRRDGVDRFGQARYRPIDSLLFRTDGRHVVQGAQSAGAVSAGPDRVLTVFDPCLLPDSALDEFTDEYIPENDDREPHVLETAAPTASIPRPPTTTVSIPIRWKLPQAGRWVSRRKPRSPLTAGSLGSSRSPTRSN